MSKDENFRVHANWKSTLGARMSVFGICSVHGCNFLISGQQSFLSHGGGDLPTVLCLTTKH
jgi:hypothetical protein